MISKNEKIDLSKIKSSQRKITSERDWDKFHTPKNIAMALSGEAGELTEIFQWLTAEESYEVMKNEKSATNVKDEVADIFFYLVRLCDLLDIDLESAYWQKVEKNLAKYPVNLAKGNAKKYTEF